MFCITLGCATNFHIGIVAYFWIPAQSPLAFHFSGHGRNDIVVFAGVSPFVVILCLHIQIMSESISQVNFTGTY